jgi:hypothetical protein
MPLGFHDNLFQLAERLETLERAHANRTRENARLSYKLDPQTDAVLELKFTAHSANGRSHKTLTQSISDTTETKVVWQANTFASEVTWNSTNNRFIVKRAGTYRISAAVTYESSAANGLYQILIHKNGSEYSRATVLSNASAGFHITPSVNDLLELSQDDYIEITTYHSSGGAKSIGGSSNLCYFNIHRIA